MKDMFSRLLRQYNNIIIPGDSVIVWDRAFEGKIFDKNGNAYPSDYEDERINKTVMTEVLIHVPKIDIELPMNVASAIEIAYLDSDE